MSRAGSPVRRSAPGVWIGFTLCWIGAGGSSQVSAPDQTSLDRGGLCFVIDPIDGTSEFAAGRSGFAICVALFDDGSPAGAMLDLPAQDRRFSCVVGGGTFLNGRRVHLSGVDRLSDATLAIS